MLINHSRSYKDLTVRINNRKRWISICKKCISVLNSLLSKLETAALIVIVFTLANARELNPPIIEAERINYSWCLISLAIVGLVTTVWLGTRYLNLEEETPLINITGPLTQDQYESLQETLTNQALIDNLAISPIGDLWILPF
jgi:hypothetical protein